MIFSNENDGYDAEANSYGCWKLGVRMLRLEAIRSGKAMPRTDDPEEMEAARGERALYEPTKWGARVAIERAK